MPYPRGTGVAPGPRTCVGATVAGGRNDGASTGRTTAKDCVGGIGANGPTACVERPHAAQKSDPGAIIAPHPAHDIIVSTPRAANLGRLMTAPKDLCKARPAAGARAERFPEFVNESRTTTPLRRRAAGA